MKKLEPGFPRFKDKKKKKSSWISPMSEKTRDRMEERKKVVEETHLRAKGRCEAGWIAPEVSCSSVRHADEKHTRGRFRSGTQYDLSVTQSICSKCDHVKQNEVWAAEIYGLYGEQGLKKHEPISAEDFVKARELFVKRKRGAL